MAKIKVEIEVPNDGCKCCIMFDAEYRVCELFNCYRPYNYDMDNYERCEQCKQGEVQKIKQGFVKNRLTISPYGCNMGL